MQLAISAQAASEAPPEQAATEPPPASRNKPPSEADQAQAGGEAPPAVEAQAARAHAAEAHAAEAHAAEAHAAEAHAAEAHAAEAHAAEGPRGWRLEAVEAPVPRARGEASRAAAQGGKEEEEEEGEDGGLVERLLRSPQAFFRAMDTEADLVPVTRTLLLSVGAGAGVFGAVVGAYRGGIQVLYAAVKVPLLLVATLAICMPAFVALARAMEVKLRAREVVVLALGASARFALVLAGLAPVLWLLSGWLGYHGVALAITASCVVAGAGAAALLFRGLARRGGSGALAGLAFVAVFGVVGGQTSWLLRPFLVRPKTTHVPFVRSLEGDLLDAVRRTSRSAAGIYDEPAPAAEPGSP